MDWFGIYFRAGENSFLGSHLLYIRRNGKMEVAIYPGPHAFTVKDTQAIDTDKHELSLEFENNSLHARLAANEFQIDRLSHQTIKQLAAFGWQRGILKSLLNLLK